MEGVEFSKEPTLEIISFFNGLISEIEYYTDCFKDIDIKAEDLEYLDIVQGLLAEVVDIGRSKEPTPGTSDLLRRASQHADQPAFNKLVKKIWRQWFADFDFDVINEDNYLHHLLPNEQIYDESVEVYSLFPVFSFNDDYCKLLIEVLEKRFKQFSTCYEQLKTVYSEVGSASHRKHQIKRDSEWYDQSQSPTGLSLGQRSPKISSQYTEYLYVEERRLFFDQLPQRIHPKTGEALADGSHREFTRFDDISSIQMTPHKTSNDRNPSASVEKGQGFISEEIDLSMKRKLEDSSMIFNDLHDRIRFDTRDAGVDQQSQPSDLKAEDARSSLDNVSIDKIDLGVEEQTPRLPSNQEIHPGGLDSNQQFNSVRANTLRDELTLSRLNEFTFKDSSRRKDHCSGESTERAPQPPVSSLKPTFVIHTRDFMVEDSPQEDQIHKKSDCYISLLFSLDKFFRRVQLRTGFEGVLFRSLRFDCNELLGKYERGDRLARRKVSNMLDSSCEFARQYSSRRLIKSAFKAWIFSVVEKPEEGLPQYFSPPTGKTQKKPSNCQEVWEWDSAGFATLSSKAKHKDLIDSKHKPALSIGSEKSKKGVQIMSARNLVPHSNDILQSKPTPMNSTSVVARIGSQDGKQASESNDMTSSHITKELDFTKPHISEFRFVSNPSHKHLPQAKWDSLLRLNNQPQSTLPTKKKLLDQDQPLETEPKPQPAPTLQRGQTQESKDQMKEISEFTAHSKNSEADQTRRIMLKIILRRTVKHYARLAEATYARLASFARSPSRPDPKPQNASLQTIQEDAFESFEPRDKLNLDHESFPLDLDFRSPMFDRRIERHSSRPSITFGPQTHRLPSDRNSKEQTITNRLSDTRGRDSSRSASRGSNNKSTDRLKDMDYINQRIKLSIAKTAAKFSAGKTPPNPPSPIIYTYERATKPPAGLKSTDKRADSKSRSRSQPKKKPFVTGLAHSRSRSSSPVNSAAFLRKPASLVAAHMKADVKKTKRLAEDGKGKYRSILDGKLVKDKALQTPQKPQNPLEQKKPSRYEVILRNFEQANQERKQSRERPDRSKSPLDSKRKVVPVHLIHRDPPEKENRRPSSIIATDREKQLAPSRSQSKLRKR